jgi:hypothetical protein
MSIIEFEEIEVTLPLYIRGECFAVYDVHHSRPRRKSHKAMPPVVYIDVYKAESPVVFTIAEDSTGSRRAQDRSRVQVDL